MREQQGRGDSAAKTRCRPRKRSGQKAADVLERPGDKMTAGSLKTARAARDTGSGWLAVSTVQ